MKKIFTFFCITILALLATNLFGQWSVVTGIYGGDIKCIINGATANTLYCGTSNGVFVSTNNGGNWTRINTGLPNDNGTVQSLFLKDTLLYAAVYFGNNNNNNNVYYSGISNINWTILDAGVPNNRNFSGLAIMGDSIYLGTTDNGVYWNKLSVVDAWTQQAPGNNNVRALIVDTIGRDTLYVATAGGSGVYLRTPTTAWAGKAGITGGSVNCLLLDADTLWAGSSTNGVWRCGRNNHIWGAQNTGLTPVNVQALAMNGTTIFAGCNNNAIWSSNLTANLSWNRVSTGLVSTTQNIVCLAIGSTSTDIFAGSPWGLFYSGNGTSWSTAVTGMSNISLTDISNHTFAVYGGKLYAITNRGGVFESTDNGVSWAARNTGLLSYDVKSITLNTNGLFAGTTAGVFYSSDGINWTQRNGTFPTYISNYANIRAIVGRNDTVYMATDSIVYMTNDNGISWIKIMSGLPSRGFDTKGMALNGSYLFVVSENLSIWRSPVNNHKWTPVIPPAIPSNGLAIRGIHAYAGKIYIGTRWVGSWMSPDNGVTWVDINNNQPDFQPYLFIGDGNTLISKLINNQGQQVSFDAGLNWARLSSENIGGGNLFAGNGQLFGVLDGVIYRRSTTVSAVNFSANNTQIGVGAMVSFTDASTNTPTAWSWQFPGGTPSTSAVQNPSVYYNTPGNYDVTLTVTNAAGQSSSIKGAYINVFASTTTGAWVQTNGIRSGNIKCMAKTASGAMYVGTIDEGVLFSNDNGATWTTKNGSGATALGVRNISCIETAGNNVFVGTGVGFFYSTDNGSTWAIANNGLLNTDVKCIAAKDTNIYIGTGNGVYKTSLNSMNWAAINTTGLTRTDIRSIAVYGGDTILAGTTSTGTDGGIYRWTNGTSWTKTYNHHINNKYISSIVIFNDTVYVGKQSNGVARSINRGGSFTDLTTTGLTSQEIRALAVTPGNTLYAASVQTGTSFNIGGLYRYVPGTTPTWIRIDTFTNTYVYALQALNGTTLAAGGNVGIIVSTDNGTSWSVQNGTLSPKSYVSAMLATPNYIYAAVRGGGVYVSSDKGATWNMSFTGKLSDVRSFCYNSVLGTVYAGAIGSVFQTTDNGNTWTALLGGAVLPATNTINALAFINDTVYAGTSGSGVYMWAAGAWTAINSGPMTGATGIRNFAVKGNKLYAAVNGGVFIWNSSIWVQRNTMPNTNINCIGISGNNIFAGNTNNNSNVMAVSNDDGLTWTALNNGIPRRVSGNADLITQFFLLPAGGNILSGTDYGVHLMNGSLSSYATNPAWTKASNGLPNYTAQAPMRTITITNLVTNGEDIYAASQTDGIYRMATYADFSSTYTTAIKEMDSVSFTDLSTNNPIKWKWTITPGTAGLDFVYRMGTTDSTQNPVIRFDSSGTYTVQLVATGLGGKTVVKTDYITVTTNLTPTLNAIANANICQGAVRQTSNLSGITAGGSEVQTLVITATSDNILLIPNDSIFITYSSPATTGTISYRPVGTQVGDANITVTVTDDGSPVKFFSRIFKVTVANVQPTLGNIVSPDPFIMSGSNQSGSVKLTGIMAGLGETQTLTVTASSNNTSLVPDASLVVTYTSPHDTGSVAFTAQANQNGTAVITVRVTDDGNPNLFVEKTFSVVVKAYYTLTTQKTGNGTVTTGGTFISDTVISITATPDASNRFDHWNITGIGNVSSATTVVTMTGNITATAYFIKTGALVTNRIVTAGGGSGGAITPASGSYIYDSAIVITLIAAPAATYRFDRWNITGTGDVFNDTASVTINIRDTATAYYVRMDTLFTSTADTNGIITPDTGIYDVGTIVALTATPDAGYGVVAWNVNGVNNADTLKTRNYTMQWGTNRVIVDFDLLIGVASIAAVEGMISVYPVPAKQTITVRASDAVSSIEILNILGAPVKMIKPVTSNVININDLTKGVYLIRITTVSGQVSIIRITKE